MISNLQMITIYVRDMQRAVEFYTEKLGFVKLAEYNDGKDHSLTWVIPQPASKNDPATQIVLNSPFIKPLFWVLVVRAPSFSIH